MTLQLRLAIAARKGGVGKTTLCTGLASVFAASGLRTAVIDLDPQSNAAFALGLDPAVPGAAQLILGQAISPLLAMDNLWVYPGGPSLMAREIEQSDPEDLFDRVAPLPYEVILCDCPPGSEHLERLALVSSSVALLALDAHPFAISGVVRVMEVIKNRKIKGRPGPETVAMVASRIDLRRSGDRELEANLNELFPNIPILRMRQDIALANAAAVGIPINKAAPESRGLQDLLTIKEWIHDQFN